MRGPADASLCDQISLLVVTGALESALSLNEKGVLPMNFKESGKIYESEVLMACFNSLTEAHRAQQILIGYGYPRDAVTVVEMSHFAHKLAAAKDIPHKTINKILIFVAILISTMFITLACLFMKSIISPAEMGVMILVWITLTAGGVVICSFIGAIVWKIIHSTVVDWGLEAVKRQRILIGVRLQTPDDAEQIEREWKAIGCEMV